MRFSTVAVSVAMFGAAAMALPGSVVYETQIVTITSCGPDKPNCPGKTASATSSAYTAPPAPPVTTKVSPAPSVPVVPSVVPPAPSAGVSIPAGPAPNGTYVHPAPSGPKPVCPGGPNVSFLKFVWLWLSPC
jgi:hypothetical protein